MAFKIARVEECFKSPGPQPNGLHAAADGLWCIDQEDLKLYKLDWETGEVRQDLQTDTEHSSGVTMGNGALWVASTFELKIAQIDLQTGKTIAKYDSPGSGKVTWAEQSSARVTGAHGLEWKDGELYIAVPPSQCVHVIEVEDWKEVHSFRAPGLRVHGLAWADDGTLWVADTSAGTVSRMDVDSGMIWEVVRVEAPTEIHGLTIRDNVLWYCDATSRAIGQLHLD
jgi:streptogramin lyase